MKFSDIPPYSQKAGWACEIGWNMIEATLGNLRDFGELQMDPDFQRAHVWTETQQIRYIEHILRDGQSGRDIFWNCATWHTGRESPVVLVDGKQRLHAVRRFMANEITAFGHRLSEFEGQRPPLDRCRLHFHVNDLPTRAEVLQWYLDINAAGTPHTEDELALVRGLLQREIGYG